MATLPLLLVCDDAPGFRLIIQTVFEDGGFRVAGTADSWERAEALARDLQPDAILLDLWLPTFERDGIARVRAAAPSALLAVVSSLAAGEIGELTGGLSGIDLVLSKREAPDVLLRSMLGGLRERSDPASRQ
jgi:CheY-like chemotaxis protein